MQTCGSSIFHFYYCKSTAVSNPFNHRSAHTNTNTDCALQWGLPAAARIEIAVHGRKRVELSIRNNIDEELEGPYEIYSGEGRELCAILEEYRPDVEWFSVRSVNLYTSPPWNWPALGRTAADTRAAGHTMQQPEPDNTSGGDEQVAKLAALLYEQEIEVCVDDMCSALKQCSQDPGKTAAKIRTWVSQGKPTGKFCEVSAEELAWLLHQKKIQQIYQKLISSKYGQNDQYTVNGHFF